MEWILIPITAILAGMFSEWIKFRTKQRELGVSTKDVEREVAALKADRDALVERLQNLEAIVVSQTWNALHESAVSPAERELKVASAARRELASMDTDASNTLRAQQLAQRLRG